MLNQLVTDLIANGSKYGAFAAAKENSPINSSKQLLGGLPTSIVIGPLFFLESPIVFLKKLKLFAVTRRVIFLKMPTYVFFLEKSILLEAQRSM